MEEMKIILKALDLTTGTSLNTNGLLLKLTIGLVKLTTRTAAMLVVNCKQEDGHKI